MSLRQRMIVPFVLALVGVVSGALGSAPASAATTSTFFYAPLLTDHGVVGSDVTPPTTILLKELTLQAGESRRVMDRLQVTITSNQGAEVDNYIVCSYFAPGVGWQELPGSSNSSGSNHKGAAAGSLVLYETVLLRAETAGRYRCELKMRTSDGTRTNFRIVARAQETWLQFSSTDEVGSRVWWTSPHCASDGEVGCTYIGASGGPTSAWAFPDSAQPQNLWQAAADTTDVDVSGTLQVTSCPQNTSSCSDGHRGGDDFARIQSFLMLNQLYPDGTVCRTYYSDDPDAELGSRYSISNSVHHLPIRYYLSAPVSPNCKGSRTFTVNVFEGWDSGNPVKLDGGSLVAIDRVRTTTATVPNVLGTSQAQATATLQAQGFVPSVLTVLDPAPAGTILAENSRGGTVEPTGSVVQLTVSLGGAIVPNVVGRTGPTATATLQAAGLVVGPVSQTTTDVSSVDNQVRSQSVQPGTLVAKGTTVSLNVWHFVPDHCGPSSC